MTDATNTDTNDQFSVEYREDEKRYVLLDNAADGGPKVIGEESTLDTNTDGANERIFYHTEVSEDYAGQGLASVLVKEAIESAIADGQKIVPVCPYVTKWLPRHPEYNEHVVQPTTAHLRALGAK